MHEPQYTRRNVVHFVHCRDELHSFSFILHCGLRLVDCGSYLQICDCRNPRAAIHELNCILPRGLRLVDCGTAAVGVELPQYKPFYMVPQKCSFAENIWTKCNFHLVSKGWMLKQPSHISLVLIYRYYNAIVRSMMTISVRNSKTKLCYFWGVKYVQK